MNQDTEHFRNKLLGLKKEALDRIETIERDIKHEDIPKDWEDQAAERENDEVLESLGKITAEELQQINEALARLDEGSYFTCSECGAPIPAERLELLPYTTLCVACAERHEKEQRL